MRYTGAMDFLKSITGKVVSAILALGVIVAAFSWWSMDPQSRDTLISGSVRIVVWVLGVLLLPWATFFISAWVARFGSNLAGITLVSGYTILEAVVLLWLFDWSLSGSAAWSFAVVGVLFAATYNVLVCDWIAEKSGY